MRKFRGNSYEKNTFDLLFSFSALCLSLCCLSLSLSLFRPIGESAACAVVYALPWSEHRLRRREGSSSRGSSSGDY